jgi:hypothetical protein
MTENEAGGDLLHKGVTTIDSKRPPPTATATEKQSRINEHCATIALLGPLLGAGSTKPKGLQRERCNECI